MTTEGCVYVSHNAMFLFLQLQSACADLAQCLDCSVEGVAAESVRDILHSQATSLRHDRQQTQQQVRLLKKTPPVYGEDLFSI